MAYRIFVGKNMLIFLPLYVFLNETSMGNILIADAGSTKTQWVLMDHSGGTTMCNTNGFNPNYNDINELIKDLQTSDLDENNLPPAHQADLECVYYYGTGCGSEKNCSIVANALQTVFGDVRVEVTHDMMAAARAVLGNKKGVACIMGTGSNACLYDGAVIVQNAVSLGYVLGDEGGGVNIGGSLLRDYFYRRMPVEISAKFEELYHPTRDELIENVYRKTAPSAYLASFAKFAGQNKDNQYVRDLCYGCFSRFADYHILPLCDDSRDVGFVGSVAYSFSDILSQCMSDKGLNVSNIVKQPIDGLVKYHRDRI